VTITQSVQTIVPYVTGQERGHASGHRRTKPVLLRYVALSLHSLSPKMAIPRRIPSPR
jgi:hypothetical protein